MEMKQDELRSPYRSNKLRNRQSGDGCLGLVVAIAAMPVCAYVGSYIGEGLGYLWGNFIDCIPYVRDVTPWVAERSGLITDSNAVDLNENLYQTTGAIAGFYAGLWLPWNLD